MKSETTLELINKVAEFTEISETMQDDELAEVLALVVKLMMNPDVPPAKATLLIVQLEAFAAKFAMLASYYTNVKKDDRVRKNIYFSAKEATQRLCDSMKYAAKAGTIYG